MPRAAPAIVSLNSGELSPLAASRLDLDKYGASLSYCQNFLPLVQGGLRNRPGVTHIAAATTSTLASKERLVSFVYSLDQAYVLEFSNLKFRIYRNRAQIISGTPVEVVTPWATADLAQLQFCQSADVLYVTHPSYPPYQIARTSDTSWTCTQITFNEGPFLDDNPDSTTITVTGTLTVGGSCTLTFSAPYATANMVGGLFRIWSTDIDIANFSPWEPGKSYTSATSRVYQNGKVYLSGTTATSGTIPPTHEEGARWDGLNGTNVKWTFESAFFGVVRITGFTSSTVLTATVVQRLPQALSSKASTRWAEGAWSAENGYPACVTFYQDRLTFGCSTYQPDTLWMSGVGDYLNFGSFNLSGQITSDLAITVTLSSQQVNRIRWMTAEGGGLLVGTEASEYLISPANAAEGISQSNIRALAQSSYGSAAMSPVRIGAVTLAVQRATREVREILYDFQIDRYAAQDLTILADELTKPGIATMAYAQDPHSVVWTVLTDGALRSLTYDREQAVTGWGRHMLGGTSPVVESVACIPSPDGTKTDVWLCVRQTINGSLYRWIGCMQFDRDLDGALIDANHLDCSVTYSGAATVTITGLAPLNGETVKVIADGYVHPDRTVSGGQITLERAASKVHVGFYSAAEAETIRMEAGAANGTAQGKKKKISEVIFRLYQSAGGLGGPRGGDQDRLLDRLDTDPMTGAVALRSEDASITWQNGYDRDGKAAFKQDVPLPFVVTALFPTITTQDG